MINFVHWCSCGMQFVGLGGCSVQAREADWLWQHNIP